VSLSVRVTTRVKVPVVPAFQLGREADLLTGCLTVNVRGRWHPPHRVYPGNRHKELVFFTSAPAASPGSGFEK
jgi:hypothetical protein